MPTTKFLFGNINRKPVADVVAELAENHRIDVLILAESAIAPSSLLATLNSAAGNGFHLSVGVSKGITILTRFSREFLRPVFVSDHISVSRIRLPARSELLLAAVHLPSKLHWSHESQSIECGVLARRIAEEEDRAGHQQTVLVGDLNMNPFRLVWYRVVG